MDDREDEERAGEDVERFGSRAMKKFRAEVGDAVILKRVERAWKIHGGQISGARDGGARDEQHEDQQHLAEEFRRGCFQGVER